MKYFLPLFLLFVLASCSVQKRLYNKGFYVSKSQPTNKADIIKDTAKQVSLLHTIKQKEETNAPLLATAVKAIAVITKKQNLLQDPCDTIVMKTGEKILGKVIKVKEDKVFFENCDGQGYSSSSLPNRDVNHIIYASVLHYDNLEHKKKRHFLIAKLIAFFLLLLSIILFAIAFNQIGTLMPLLMMLASLVFIVSIIMLLVVFISKNRK